MLQIAPRFRIHVSRFPPIPFFGRRRPAPISPADRRFVQAVLAGGPPRLPTDLPDLAPLLTLAGVDAAGDAVPRATEHSALTAPEGWCSTPEGRYNTQHSSDGAAA